MAVVTRRIKANRGGALVLVLLVLLLFTLLGAAAVQMGHQELVQGGLQFAQQEAGDLAESGIELAIGWFARPDAFDGMVVRSDFPCPAAETPRELLAKRCRRETGRLSFLTGDGESQFQGTPAAPDGIMRLDASTLLPIAVAPAAGAT
ncbi:MAG TPA: PilX N-terminal domain-containing pilus assembly protein, partial [Nitrospiria bacterium]|nr:PilX N-terminal domain-containing pilus assembly protein [Nitrospiria bacterium]